MSDDWRTAKPREMTDEENKFVADFLEKMVKFEKKETDLCVHCGKQVKQIRQVGRCVYASPCGCRLWQGRIPEAWKNAKS